MLGLTGPKRHPASTTGLNASASRNQGYRQSPPDLATGLSTSVLCDHRQSQAGRNSRNLTMAWSHSAGHWMFLATCQSRARCQTACDGDAAVDQTGNCFRNSVERGRTLL